MFQVWQGPRTKDAIPLKTREDRKNICIVKFFFRVERAVDDGILRLSARRVPYAVPNLLLICGLQDKLFECHAEIF